MKKEITILYGIEAIEYKERHPEASINKYADPIEGELLDVDIDDALDIIQEDPSLIYVEVDHSRQWAVVCDGRLIATYGRKKNAMACARDRARAEGWGARALLLTQDQIDDLD